MKKALWRLLVLCMLAAMVLAGCGGGGGSTSDAGSANVAVTGVSMKSTTGLLVNGSEQLTATIAPANATNQGVTWSSSNTEVASVSATGRERVGDFVAGLKDPLQASYHVRRSFEAIVNGGWFGVGLGQSRSKLTGLPVPPTDSVFAVLAEELGLFGAVVLIALYGALIWRGFVIARRAPDMLGTILASGFVMWIGMEALINMSVMVGLLPFAGNALPFISAGGSNLVATLAALGILFNISRQTGEGTITDDEWRSYGAIVDMRWWNRRRSVSRTRRSSRTNVEAFRR